MLREKKARELRIGAALAQGRLVNLAAAEGHPSEVMDMSFANQFLGLLKLTREGRQMQKQVYDLPKEQDEELASRKLLLGHAGGHVVASTALYGGSQNLLHYTLRRFGIETTFVKPGDIAAWRAAIGHPDLSPRNLTPYFGFQPTTRPSRGSSSSPESPRMHPLSLTRRAFVRTSAAGAAVLASSGLGLGCSKNGASAQTTMIPGDTAPLAQHLDFFSVDEPTLAPAESSSHTIGMRWRNTSSRSRVTFASLTAPIDPAITVKS